MSYATHIQSSKHLPVRCAIITLSDTRTASTDLSGKKIAELICAADLQMVHHQVLPDEPAGLKSTLNDLLCREDIDVILTTGGTGFSRRDQTIDVIESLLERPIDGFGELFRSLSYQEIGSGAMLSRAIAGVVKAKLIFAMPGSIAAVELAMTRLILPELKHLLHELRK